MDLQTALEFIRIIIKLASLLVEIVDLAGRERVHPPAGSQFLYMHRRIMCTFCSATQSFEHTIRLLLS